MDYPFYLLKLMQLEPETLQQILSLLDEKNVDEHPHFTSKERNPGTFRLHDPNNLKVVDLVSTALAPHLPKAALYWHEFNLIAPGGKVGEHSDLAYAGYNRQKGNPMEVLLTHKIHVHLKGTPQLAFRRSRYEALTLFEPEVGGCYWYNNYSLHSSHNPSSDENRIALSLIYWDRDWSIRGRLFDKHQFLFQKAYQL